MAEDNKPQGNEGGEGQQTEPQKEVVSYAKYKRETDEYQEQVKALKAELEQRDKQIEEFTSKAGNAEELQAALDKAKADNEAYKADAEKREADMRRDFAIDTKLAQMGVRNAKAARAIIPNIADAKLDEQGNLTGIDFEALKKDNAYMFTDQPRESAGGDPKGGAGSDGLADFRAAFGLRERTHGGVPQGIPDRRAGERRAAGQHRADGAAGRVLLPRLLHGRPGRRAGKRATAPEQRRVPDLEAHQRQLRPWHHPGNRPEGGRPVLQPGVR